MKRFFSVALLVFAALLAPSMQANAAVWRVNWNGPWDGDGTSWAKAFRSIDQAIEAASGGDQIWVFGGEYNLAIPIVVNKAVKIYGGFGSGATALSQRNVEKNETIIKMVNVPKKRCFDISADATIDGFTITGGLASGTGNDCRGGAVFVQDSSPIFQNCFFHTNRSECNGGAIYLNDSPGASISNCIFTRNQTDASGGAIFANASNPKITNCTFSNNSAQGGGAIYNTWGTTTLTNCVLWQDHGKYPSVQEVDNSSGSVIVSYSIVDQDGYAGDNNNIRQDPGFLMTSADNFRLRPDSPAVDAGVCAVFEGYHYVRIAPYTDFESDLRPAFGAMTGCDVGADEYQAHITVNTVNDELTANGNCSLREAVIAANTDTPVDACPAGNGFDIVHIPAGLYLLSIPGKEEDSCATGDLDLQGGIALIGVGPGKTVIDGGALDRVIDRQLTGGYSELLDSVVVSDLTIRNGLVSDADSEWPNGGGGVLNRSLMLLENVELSGNEVRGSSTYAIGGGLRGADTGSTTTLVRCSVHDNIAVSGGGIVSNGNLEMRDCTVYGNAANTNSALRALRETIITGSTFSKNENTASPTDAVVFLQANALLDDYATLTNVTVSGNTGGGITNAGRLSLNHCTIANNSAFGLYQSNWVGWELILRDSILSHNLPNCGAYASTIPSSGFNISSDGSCGLDQVGDKQNTDPRLTPLGGYGGFTLTHGLLPASPAIDAAGGSDCPATDQRGMPRPFGRGCDIGAFEFSGWAMPWMQLLLDE